MNKNKIQNSFDVFDTCIARLWANPSDLFIALGQYLQKLDLIGKEVKYLNIRQQAELEVWKNGNFAKQPTLDQIYQYLSEYFKWTIEDKRKAQGKEIELEINSVKPILETLAFINKLHDDGQSVVFISDMYLPENVILSMLVKNGFWKEGDRLYVSSEVGVLKHNGRLFRYVLRDLNQRPYSIVHTGDNFRSDFVMSWMSGFKGKFFQSGLLHSREMETYTNMQRNMIGSRFAAVSRLTRLSFDGAIKYKGLWDVVTTGFSPLIFSFAFHCLIKAKEKGFTNIYFCSRDGNLPMKVAKVINEHYKLGFNINYLLSSRSAWCKTALTGSNSIGIDIALQTKGCSIRQITANLGLCENSYKKIQSFLEEQIDIDTPLSEVQKEKITKGLRSTVMHDELSEVEVFQRDAFMLYFKESGMDFNTGFLVVDAFSRGTMETLFNGMVADAGIRTNRSEWIYLELLNESKRNSINSYLDQFRGISSFSRVAVTEALLKTNEPSFIKLNFSKNKLFPVFGKEEYSSEAKLMHDIIHQACTKFAELICQNLLLKESYKGLIDLYATKSFESLVCNPSKEEAKSISVILFEDMNKKTLLVKSVGLRDFVKSIRWKVKPNNGQLILDGCWMEGSLVISNFISRSIIKFILKGKPKKNELTSIDNLMLELDYLSEMEDPKFEVSNNSKGISPAIGYVKTSNFNTTFL